MSLVTSKLCISTLEAITFYGIHIGMGALQEAIMVYIDTSDTYDNVLDIVHRLWYGRDREREGTADGCCHLLPAH